MGKSYDFERLYQEMSRAELRLSTIKEVRKMNAKEAKAEIRKCHETIDLVNKVMDVVRRYGEEKAFRWIQGESLGPIDLITTPTKPQKPERSEG